MTFVRILLLAAVGSALHAQLSGTWTGEASYKGQKVPLTVEFSGSGSTLRAAFRNGAERSPASAVTLTGNHLVLTFDYYARTLTATLDGTTLAGTFGYASGHADVPRFPVVLHPALPVVHSNVRPHQPDLSGDWEIEVKSEKDEAAWLLRIDKRSYDPSAKSYPWQPTRAVIQRIDGDTGSLFSQYSESEASELRLSHFTAAGAALYSVKPESNGTLLVSNLLNKDQTNLVARRPEEARKQKLTEPTDPTRQTTIKDPNVPFRFSFPDMSGKVVSNTDARFEGKVVIVAIGGSWCPNCHDEAPLLESLYTRFHSRGLEIVDLSFEEPDQIKDPARLRAFIARYAVTYTVLVAGDPDDVNKKLPQAEHLNSWPTSFFLSRDGRVREVHAGFAGPANPAAHAQLEKDVTELVEHLLAEPVPSHTARR